MTEKGGKKILVIVTICIILISILFCGCIGDDDEGEIDEISIEVEVVDKGEYWEITIIEINDKTIDIEEIKFQHIFKSGVVVISKTINDSNPSYLISDKSKIYPIPSIQSGMVYENSTYGDGEIIDNSSVAKPQFWEGCEFVFIDIKNDKKLNVNDYIRIYKDLNDDNIDEISTECGFIIENRTNDIILRIIF